jgi:ankyrin repeat protein
MAKSKSKSKAPAKAKKPAKAKTVKKAPAKPAKKVVAKKKVTKEIKPKSPLADILEDARKGKIRNVISFLKNGGDVNVQENNTLLIESVIGGHLELVEELLTRGADVNLGDNAKRTPLHFAAGLGMTKIVDALIKNDTNLNAKDVWGMTALHYVAKGPKSLGFEGNPKELGAVVKLLLKAGADINAEENSGRTALFFASAMETSAKKELEKAGGVVSGKPQLEMF